MIKLLNLIKMRKQLKNNIDANFVTNIFLKLVL